MNLRVFRSFLEGVVETRREPWINSRSEFHRYALRDSVNHPESAGIRNDLVRREAQLDEADAIPCGEMKAKSGIDDA